MNIRSEQLQIYLDRQLLPVYLVFGDDPLLVKEACEQIMDHAKNMGYDERSSLDVVPGFDWQQLAFLSGNASLFSNKKLIDLRVGNGKPGKEGSRALLQYLEGDEDENLLLIRMPYLNRQATQAKWFKAIQNKGGVVQIWPISVAQTPSWIQRRARVKGIGLKEDSARVIAEMTEGNLLAADQLLERLQLDFGKGAVSLSQVVALVADDSQFEIGNLLKYSLLGNGNRVHRVWRHLKAMKEPQSLILWVLSDAVRNLIELSARGATAALQKKIRRELMPGYQATVKRHSLASLYDLLQQLAVVDRRIKGVCRGDSWEAILQVALTIALPHGVLPLFRK